MADLKATPPASARAVKYLQIADQLDYGSTTCPIPAGSLFRLSIDEIYQEAQEAAHAHDAIAMRVLNSRRVLEATEAAIYGRREIEASLLNRSTGGVLRGWSTTKRLTYAIKQHDETLDHLRKVLTEGYAEYVGRDTTISPEEQDLLAELEQLRAA